MNVIMGRTASMLSVDTEEKREEYLKAATSVLTAGAIAVMQLAGNNNENLFQLFQTQCAFKAASLAAVTKEAWLSVAKINQTMDKFNSLEQALEIKARELKASSSSISLPMSDSKGQSAIVAKIIARLRKQMDAFQSIETALPTEIRMETKKLAESMSGLESEVTVTIDQMDACCQHLKKCLNVLVEFIFKMRQQRES